ncbi:MAG TPA: hypothetical protein VFF30_14425 [Nitrososphaerales archaeon]|nr:hypothetical protein [Nitrososphaerales archaeon]
MTEEDPYAERKRKETVEGVKRSEVSAPVDRTGNAIPPPDRPSKKGAKK